MGLLVYDGPHPQLLLLLLVLLPCSCPSLLELEKYVRASEAIGERVARTPGSLAVVDLGNLRLRSAPVWISRLKELSPVYIELRLVTEGPIATRLKAFVEFITSPDGRALVNDLGFQSVVAR